MDLKQFKNQQFSRQATFEVVKDDAGTAQVNLSFSSEEPYLRSFGYEILSHRAEDVDMSFIASGNAPLLLGHDHTTQIGVVENAKIENGRGVASVRFSRSALGQEIEQDVLDGIRRNVSVGYEITDAKVGKKSGDIKSYIMSWRPYEISIVSVPADTSVGVGRNQQTTHIFEGKTEMENEKIETTPAVDMEAVKAEIMAGERKRVSTIMERAATLKGKIDGIEAIADDFIKSGKSIDDFNNSVVEAIEKRQVSIPAAPAVHTKQHTYSLTRAMNAAVNPRTANAGLELETSDELAHKMRSQGLEVPPGAIVLPNNLQRTMSVGGVNVGSDLVAAEHMPQDFLRALYSKTFLDKVGARFMPGLVGNPQFPKQDGKSTAQWDGEADTIVASNVTTTKFSMTPHRLTGRVERTDLLGFQAEPAIDAIIYDDIQKQHVRALNEAALVGTSPSPVGLLSALTGSSVYQLGTAGTGAAFTFADLIAIERFLEDKNALEGSLAWVINPKVKSKLRSTIKLSNTAAVTLWDEMSDSIIGYNTAVSTIVPSNTGTNDDLSIAVFGDFSKLWIGQFGSPYLFVNPYRLAHQGLTEVQVSCYYDIKVARDESFVVVKDIVTV